MYCEPRIILHQLLHLVSGHPRLQVVLDALRLKVGKRIIKPLQYVYVNFNVCTKRVSR